MLENVAMYGSVIDGCRHDIGNKLDFLRTNVIFGLDHPEIGPEFRQFLRELAAAGLGDGGSEQGDRG